MAYRIPTMPILCNIYDFAGFVFPPFAAPRIANRRCQLRYLKTASALGGVSPGSQTMLLLLDPGTDIRMYDAGPGISADTVEVPAGSGLFYQVNTVGDVARGFANEYRSAVIFSQNYYVGGWMTPMP